MTRSGHQAVESSASQLDAFDTTTWLLNGVVGGFLIGSADRSLLHAACWFATCLAIRFLVLPPLLRWGQQASPRYNRFWLGVVLGWAIIPGPLAGSFLGALSAQLWELPVTALQAAYLGLFIGPLVAPLEGVAIAAGLWSVVWLMTGRRLDSL